MVYSLHQSIFWAKWDWIYSTFVDNSKIEYTLFTLDLHKRHFFLTCSSESLWSECEAHLMTPAFHCQSETLLILGFGPPWTSRNLFPTSSSLPCRSSEDTGVPVGGSLGSFKPPPPEEAISANQELVWNHDSHTELTNFTEHVINFCQNLEHSHRSMFAQFQCYLRPNTQHS